MGSAKESSYREQERAREEALVGKPYRLFRVDWSVHETGSCYALGRDSVEASRHVERDPPDSYDMDLTIDIDNHEELLTREELEDASVDAREVKGARDVKFAKLGLKSDSVDDVIAWLRKHEKPLAFTYGDSRQVVLFPGAAPSLIQGVACPECGARFDPFEVEETHDPECPTLQGQDHL